MIYYETGVTLAGPQDRDKIRAILEDPSVSGTFGQVPDWNWALDGLTWLLFPGGCFGIDYRADKSAWVHVAVLPWARGRPAMEAAREVMKRLFQGGCRRICGWTPANLRAACAWNLMLGFTPRVKIKGHVLFSMTSQEWSKHGC